MDQVSMPSSVASGEGGSRLDPSPTPPTLSDVAKINASDFFKLMDVVKAAAALYNIMEDETWADIGMDTYHTWVALGECLDDLGLDKQ